MSQPTRCGCPRGTLQQVAGLEHHVSAVPVLVSVSVQEFTLFLDSRGCLKETLGSISSQNRRLGAFSLLCVLISPKPCSP